MSKRKSNKHKQKNNFTKPQAAPSTDSVMEKEIKDLAKKRGNIDTKAAQMKQGKGFLGRVGVGISATIAKVHYNKEINERKGFIRAGREIQITKRQTELARAKEELSKAQNTSGARNFNKINVDDLFRLP